MIANALDLNAFLASTWHLLPFETPQDLELNSGLSISAFLNI